MKWLHRGTGGLFRKTRQVFSRAVGILKGKRALDQDELSALRQVLIEADCGQEIADQAVMHIKAVLQQGVEDDGELLQALKSYLVGCFQPFKLSINEPLEVILIVGVNGVGKTTTIAKLAKHYQDQGHRVAIASGDTYRAAADEQLCFWAHEIGAQFIKRPNTQDPAAVMYAAMEEAKASGASILIADTAGRMHGHQGLMDQLAKVKRVMAKCIEKAPHHIWLVLDGSLGQSNLEQAKHFHACLDLDGVILTKVDGRAKGGSVISVASMGLPVGYIGSGEGVDDLMAFDPNQFVDALLEG